jgi:hypothetical protein
MTTEKHDRKDVAPETLQAIVEISDDTSVINAGAGPKDAPPKAEISRKPPGANLPKTKQSEKR